MAVAAVKKEPAKPKQGEAAAAPAEGAPPASRKKGKLLYIAIALGVLAGGGGGAAWWFSRSHEGGHEAARTQPSKPPVFAPLDNFTVNLQNEDGPQFLQVGLTLRLTDEAAVNALKLRMPEVRDRILLMLSAKKASDLLTLEGKYKLAADIQVAVNQILAPGAVAAAAATDKAPAGSPPAPAAKAPAAAGTEPAAQPAEGEAAAEGAPAAQEAAPAEPAEAAPAAAAPAQELPVTGVLFTSFIIQ